MEFSSSHKKDIALGILEQIEKAIVRLQERTAHIKCVDDFLLSPEGMEKLDAACMLLIAIGESLTQMFINAFHTAYQSNPAVRYVLTH